jgi:formylmethanofuran dehydrogenase subunit B
MNSSISKKEGNPKKIICFGCSLLCDDVFVELDADGKLIKTVNSCFRGNFFLKNAVSESRFQSSFQKSMGLFMNLSIDESMDFVKEEIEKASSIKFYGIGAISYSSQLAVMDYIKKLTQMGKNIKIENCGNIIQITNKLGLNLSSLGQAINNADVFIFWNTDPTHSHPKLVGKLLFTRGYFRSSGKEVKRLILIEEQESDLTRLKDININDLDIEPARMIENISNLLESESVKGVNFPNLDELNLTKLKDYIGSTEYGFLVTTIPYDRTESNEWFSYVGKLLDILNQHAHGRFSLLPLTLITNEMGQSFSALSVFMPDEINNLFTQEKTSEEADLAIIFGGEYLRDEYKIKEFEYPEKRLILFDNFKSDVSKRAKITIPYAIPGIEDEDIAFRFDGINIDLKKWTDPPSDVTSAEEFFKRLIDKL